MKEGILAVRAVLLGKSEAKRRKQKKAIKSRPI
jgi:hypothetical protein